MHVTVFGAGVLGRVYGARLARAGCRVTFVVRPSRVDETQPIVVEQVNGKRQRDMIEAPPRAADVPRETSAVLVAVRFDQLGGEWPSADARALMERLGEAPPVPLVVLTPLLAHQHSSLDAALGRPITPAMPSVSGYLDDRGVVRYWATAVASTLIEARPGAAEATRNALDDLARALTEAGLPARLERDVAARNMATTTAFFPLIASIDAGGGVDGLLAHRELLAQALEAAKETEALAHRLGPVATWANLLTRFVGPFTLKPAVALARKVAPEAVRFVDVHFGAKLHTQHLAMGEAILALGREHGIAMPALTGLMTRLQER